MMFLIPRIRYLKEKIENDAYVHKSEPSLTKVSLLSLGTRQQGS